MPERTSYELTQVYKLEEAQGLADVGWRIVGFAVVPPPTVVGTTENYAATPVYLLERPR